MTDIIHKELIQLGKRCSMCAEVAIYFDKYDENMPVYCHRHFPGRICSCEICNYFKSDNKNLGIDD